MIEALVLLYPQADIFVLSSTPEMIPASLRNQRIYNSYLNRIPLLRRSYDKFMVFYPSAVESMNLSTYDLVISSAGPATFGVNVSQSAMHICYCHSPERTWWDQYAARQSLSRSLTRKILYTARATYIRSWEFGAAQRVDSFVANSWYIAARVRKYFRRESTVIYPPVDTSQGYISDTNDDYYLSVGRLVPAKHIDLLIGACNLMKRRLLIAGTGREEGRLKAIAGSTIEFLGFVPDRDIPELYARSRACLFAADEDFGIVPVEAQSYGRPVIAYGHGGSLETVRVGGTDGQGDTGIFFSEQTMESLADGIRRFEACESSFRPVDIQNHAAQFDTPTFVNKMRDFVDNAMRGR